MKAGRIPVVRVGNAGAVGTPDDFDAAYARRRKGSGKPEIRPSAPKLQPVEPVNLKDRIAELGIPEEVR